MTPGERIALKRKEAGLSQEALGEELGVSRQSVYKWESGNALPDIDKLITLSRRFGVTIGWLLGVEEAEGPEENPPEEAPAELTDTQLKMVEEIVDRYLAARKPPKRRLWPWLLAGVVVVVLANVLLGELRTLKNQYDNLNSSIYNVQSNVASQIFGITNRVEEALREQTNFAASFETSVLSADLKENTVTFDASAAPKTYTEGMSAVFLADPGSGPVEVPAVQTAGQTFQAQMTCELTDRIDISVVFITGDVRETQFLQTYCGLYSDSRPPRLGVNDHQTLMYKRLDKDGNLSWHGGNDNEDFAWVDHDFPAEPVVNTEVGRAELASYRLGLFRNQKLLVWLEPCEKPANYNGFDSCEFYFIPELSVKPEPEDVFTIAAIAVDQFGNEYAYPGSLYSLDVEKQRMTYAHTDYVEWSMAYSADGWSY